MCIGVGEQLAGPWGLSSCQEQMPRTGWEEWLSTHLRKPHPQPWREEVSRTVPPPSLCPPQLKHFTLLPQHSHGHEGREVKGTPRKTGGVEQVSRLGHKDERGAPAAWPLGSTRQDQGWRDSKSHLVM